MFAYTTELAWRGLRRFPRITVLSVLALALGMGATITARTVTRLLAGDPVPGRAGQLYAVRMAGPVKGMTLTTIEMKRKHKLPDVLTLMDVQWLEAARPKVLQSAVVNTMGLAISKAAGADTKPVAKVQGLEVQSDFFRMFDVPLLEGHAWSRAEDVKAVSVAVISRALARKLFGQASAVGKPFHINGKLFRVVGVSDAWQPQPHFYGLRACIYACEAEQVFIPVSAARTQKIHLFRIVGGNGPCSFIKGQSAWTCPYLGFWALLPDAAQRADYQRMLDHYVDQQQMAGRLWKSRGSSSALQDVSAYLRAHEVVPVSVRFSQWVALVFLLVCMANVAGLLLTRFLRGARELGIRRALGATRRAVFAQCLLEAGLIGLVGGLLALPMVWAGLWLVAQQPVAYAGVIGMDGLVCLALLILAVVASVLVGVIPAWRAAVVQPGLQIKET